MRIFPREHIVTVATKISKAIGMLSKLRQFVFSSVFVNIYNALITPHLTSPMVLSLGETAVKRTGDKIRNLFF